MKYHYGGWGREPIQIKNIKTIKNHRGSINASTTFRFLLPRQHVQLSHVKGSCAKQHGSQALQQVYIFYQGCSVLGKVSKVFRVLSRARQSGGRDEPGKVRVSQVMLSSCLLKWETLGGRTVQVPQCNSVSRQKPDCPDETCK